MNTMFVQMTAGIPQLLIFVGLIVALILAIVRRRVLGRSATPAITGLALLIFDSVFRVVMTFAGYTLFGSGRMRSATDYMTVLAVQNGISGVLWAVGMGLVVVAVFTGRQPQHGAVVRNPDPGPAFPPAVPPL